MNTHYKSLRYVVDGFTPGSIQFKTIRDIIQHNNKWVPVYADGSYDGDIRKNYRALWAITDCYERKSYKRDDPMFHTFILYPKYHMFDEVDFPTEIELPEY